MIIVCYYSCVIPGAHFEIAVSLLCGSLNTAQCLLWKWDLQVLHQILYMSGFNVVALESKHKCVS